jgi:hypothetical protein
MSVEQFLAGVATAAAELPEDRKAQIMDWLEFAREARRAGIVTTGE